MSGRQLDVLVVGAGVCGLTSAICLAEAGLAVTVRAGRLPGETTSAAAGAIWGPHLVEEGGRVPRWAQATLAVLRDLAGQPGTGVAVTRGIEAWRRPAEPAGWTAFLPGLRRCGPADLPDGYRTGWQYHSPVLDMPVYLGYLLDRLRAAGGDVQVGEVGSLAEAAREAAVVVNCAGIGARDLVPDDDLRPVRGQAVIVANPGITDFFISPADDGWDLVYLFPHGDWDLAPDPAVTRQILAGCAAVEPRLADVRVLAERVGLRPVRPSVALAAEPLGAGGLLVHNYGHGGAGVSLAWGCARDVTKQILEWSR